MVEGRGFDSRSRFRRRLVHHSRAIGLWRVFGGSFEDRRCGNRRRVEGRGDRLRRFLDFGRRDDEERGRRDCIQHLAAVGCDIRNAVAVTITVVAITVATAAAAAATAASIVALAIFAGSLRCAVVTGFDGIFLAVAATFTSATAAAAATASTPAAPVGVIIIFAFFAVG